MFGGLDTVMQMSRLAKLGYEVKYRTTSGRKSSHLDKLQILIQNLSASRGSSDLFLLSHAIRKRLANPKLRSSVLKNCLEQDLPILLLDMLYEAEFESKKEIVHIIVMLLDPKEAKDDCCTILDYYLAKNGSTILFKVLHTFGDSELALHGGTIFRGCLLHRSMEDAVLTNYKAVFSHLKPNLKSKSFDVVSDAYLSFSRFLMALRQMDPCLVSDNYEFVSQYMHELLLSTEYVTQRQSLTVLRSLLFDRVHYSFMEKFIMERDNLVIIMKLLANPSVTIRWGAYHVFKVFVANPRKPEPIKRILLRNRQKLISFLKESITFTELKLELERRTVIDSLNAIEDVSLVQG